MITIMIMTIKVIVNIILVYDNNNNFVNQFFEYILLITMLTIKILFTINSLKKNYFVKTLFTIPFV